jgi:hypothetical protein
MASPFPGMDPYLENPPIWSGVHALFLAALLERIAPVLRPKYAVRFEERVYVTGEDDPAFRYIVPGVRVVERAPTERHLKASAGLTIAEPITVNQLVEDEVHERHLQILDLNDRSIVTVIELLSPTNKVAGSFGRNSFLQKRREIYASDAHWMEIDLLRDGVRTANLSASRTEYQVFLSRAGTARRGYVWPISIRERLPVIGIPLRNKDADVPLDLQDVLEAVIERGSYDLDTDYSKEPVPLLAGATSEWARPLIAAHLS